MIGRLVERQVERVVDRLWLWWLRRVGRRFSRAIDRALEWQR